MIKMFLKPYRLNKYHTKEKCTTQKEFTGSNLTNNLAMLGGNKGANSGKYTRSDFSPRIEFVKHQNNFKVYDQSWDILKDSFQALLVPSISHNVWWPDTYKE